MKIKKISCTQFAGIRDFDISFDDGLNVVYGKNESGKSTLVNLLSRTLFQNARLDRRSDKEFFDLYFPGALKNGTTAGDFIDGTISFETENGIYILKKEWGADPRCTLSTPSGVIKDQGKIDEILHGILNYGEGVYVDMLLSSQRNTDQSLQTMLDVSKNTGTKKELADAVTMAFAESDGLSVDSIGQAISAKIDQIKGKHWDLERNLPERRSMRWSNGLGKIHEAYYALEDAGEVLNKITGMERDADRASADYEICDKAAAEAEQEYRKFEEYASLLIVLSDRKDKLLRLKNDISKYTEILAHWPAYAATLQKAQALQAEKAQRELLDKYANAKQVSDCLNSLKQRLDNMLCPEQTEINGVKSAQKLITSLENELCGMNLAATVKMLGDDSVEIRSLRSGEIVDVTGENISITEAVKITVPNVLEMQLSPADVNISEIKAQLEEQKLYLYAVFARYGADSVEALEDLSRQFADTGREIQTAESRLNMLLGETSFKELEQSAKAIPVTPRSKEEIDREIVTVCEGKDISAFITATETVIGGYVKDYGDINSLSQKLRLANEEYTVTEKSMTIAKEIPAEYLIISNPENHKEVLQTKLKLKQQDRDNALKAKTESVSKLENYKQSLVGDPAANVENAERLFNEQKMLLAHWLHIDEVFKKQKEQLTDNPMHDIAESFTKYLGIISGGKVSSEFPEQDKLNMNIYSGNRLLDYGKLSEGTKETVSLAFRLAVLDHLFPEGKGIIVFDDPFTDMDGERTVQACKLLKECATRHQVIFLTCKEEYIDMLNGNTVKIG